MDLKAINPLALPSLPLCDRTALPSCPAIYFVLEGDRVLYVGRSINLQQRWMAHHRYSQLVSEARIAWLECSEPELLPDLEAALIEHFSPELNGSRVPPKNLRGISIYVKPEVFEGLKYLAEQDNRSVSNLSATILTEWFEQKKREGKLPKN